MSTNNSITSVNTTGTSLVPTETIEIQNLIYTIRGKQVMLDADLALLYRVETRTLNILEILSSPHAGYHFTDLTASKASFLNPSTDANHCEVALNMIGFLHLQQCG